MKYPLPKGQYFQRTKPVNSGNFVGMIQKELGLTGGGITNVFGPYTEQLVVNFQKTHGLDADGIVGPQTWQALFEEEQPKPTADLGWTALEIARTQVGVKEIPRGSNSGPDVLKYLRYAGGIAGQPWCVAFAAWCIGMAAQKLGIPMPIPNSLERRNPRLSSSAIYKWGLLNHRITTKPEPGDVFVVIGGDTGHYHTGLVASLAIGDRFQTIEGNSNSEGSANGESVVFRRNGRRLKTCHFIRI